MAGRIVLRRGQGKVHFLELRDWTDQIQIFLGKNQIGDAGWELAQLLDLGDLVELAAAISRVLRRREAPRSNTSVYDMIDAGFRFGIFGLVRQRLYTYRIRSNVRWISFGRRPRLNSDARALDRDARDRAC